MSHSEAEKGAARIEFGGALVQVPASSWNRVVKTACETVEAVIAPITETAAGLGRLIKAKFDRLDEVERVLAAQAVDAAKRKATQSGRRVEVPRPQVLIQVIEHASQEMDGTIRDLWANLLAQEMLTQSVHPEMGRILARLSSVDARLLAQIAEESASKSSKAFALAVAAALRIPMLDILFANPPAPTTFNHALLRNLDLIRRDEFKWSLTVTGETFIQAVTDPALENRQSD